MRITSQALDYSPFDVRRRYVRHSGGEFRFCEVGVNPDYDIRQGIVERHELPEAVAEAAINQVGYPSYVEWPFHQTTGEQS